MEAAPILILDFSTVWLFREHLIKSGKLADLWKELQRQIDEKGYTLKEGSIQDATFITSDPDRKRKKKDQKAENKKGDINSEAIGSKQIQEVDKGLLDISNNINNNQEKPIRPDKESTNEGSWAKKGVKSFFDYEGHILIDTVRHLIRAVETTTASVHDSQVDLESETFSETRGSA